MLIDDIALTLQPDIGPKTAMHLIESFGSAEALFAASPAGIREKSGLNAKMAAELAAKKYHRQAEREIAFLEKYHIHALVATEPQYPALLRECHDYPHVLYMKGDPALLQKSMVAFAGTRSITSYGLAMCETLVAGLGELLSGIVVVGGLSYGVDVACHRAALAAGIPSIVVLPHALTSIYPSHHTDLAREIVRSGGALLTEFHSTFTPDHSVFTRRNRIIAGLCEGTVVVESPEVGGSLKTALLTLDYERCLMAVPGRATDRSSGGTNALIKNLKARMVCSAEDVLRELDWEPEPDMPKEKKKLAVGKSGAFDISDVPARGSAGSPAALGKDEQGLLGCFRDRDVLSDEELAGLSGLSSGELAVLLLNLEMTGAVRALPGNRFEKL